MYGNGYIRIDKRLIGDCRSEVDTSFFSPDGASLKSQREPNIDISGSTGFGLSDATSHNFLKWSLSATQDLGNCD